MGCGDFGALGVKESNVDANTPYLVSYFKENNLKVTDAVVGEHHTIVATCNYFYKKITFYL